MDNKSKEKSEKKIQTYYYIYESENNRFVNLCVNYIFNILLVHIYISIYFCT